MQRKSGERVGRSEDELLLERIQRVVAGCEAMSYIHNPSLMIDYLMKIQVGFVPLPPRFLDASLHLNMKVCQSICSRTEEDTSLPGRPCFYPI